MIVWLLIFIKGVDIIVTHTFQFNIGLTFNIKIGGWIDLLIFIPVNRYRIALPDIDKIGHRDIRSHHYKILQNFDPFLCNLNQNPKSKHHTLPHSLRSISQMHACCWKHGLIIGTSIVAHCCYTTSSRCAGIYWHTADPCGLIIINQLIKVVSRGTRTYTLLLYFSDVNNLSPHLKKTCMER